VLAHVNLTGLIGSCVKVTVCSAAYDAVFSSVLVIVNKVFAARVFCVRVAVVASTAVIY